MIEQDPKHGRWILPVIIVAMVVLTYTFVNGIEPAETPGGSAGPDPDPPFPTTPSSSTTTLPTEVAAFLVTLDVFENQLEAFAAEAEAINARWETREVDFSPTREAFLDLKADLAQWENNVAQVDGVPPALSEGFVDLVVEVEDLAPKMDDVVLGLEAPDDGALRKAAMAEFAIEVDEAAAAIQAIRDMTASTGTTTETSTTEATGA